MYSSCFDSYLVISKMSLFFGICFILYFLKLSAGRGFWSHIASKLYNAHTHTHTHTQREREREREGERERGREGEREKEREREGERERERMIKHK